VSQQHLSDGFSQSALIRGLWDLVPGPGRRLCKTCNLHLPIDRFESIDSERRYRRHECRECRNAGRRKAAAVDAGARVRQALALKAELDALVAEYAARGTNAADMRLVFDAVVDAWGRGQE